MSDNHWVRQKVLLPIAALTISFSGCTADKKPSRVEATLANMAVLDYPERCAPDRYAFLEVQYFRDRHLEARAFRARDAAP